MSAPGAEVLRPKSPEEAAEMVRAFEAQGRTIVPSGLGNHLAPLGILPEGTALLSLSLLDGVLRHEPGDFTIGVQTGIPVHRLREFLSASGQELPVDLAPLPEATIGGAIAQDRWGPRRSRHGALRHHIIGLCGIRGGGRTWRAGGMVVKNVAGYDVAKLLVGSAGAFGPLLEANFKLRAIPAARSVRRARFGTSAGAWRLARAILDRGLEPPVLQILDPAAAAALDTALGGPPQEAWTALWTFEGNAGAVKWLDAQADRLATDSGAEAVDPIDPELCGRVLDALAARSGPAAGGSALGGPAAGGSVKSVIALRIAALPSDGPGLQEALTGAVGSLAGAPQGCREVSLASDAIGGFHIIRAAGCGGGAGVPASSALDGPPDPAARLFDAAAEAAGRFQGTVDVLQGPPSLVERARLRFHDPAGEFMGRLRAVFDPRGIFSPRAARARESGAPPPGAGRIG